MVEKWPSKQRVKYWFYNTDAKAFGGSSPAKRLLARGYAVTGGPQKFGDLLGKLAPGDTLLMYENLVGILGVGTVLEYWDGIAHENSWYYSREHEYRIRVDWYLDFTAGPIGYQEVRDEMGYIPRGALKQDLNRHDRLEFLIAQHLFEARQPKKRREKVKRVECNTLRLVRDTGLARAIKRRHEFRCQLCGERIALPDGNFYAEAHHIQPLGLPHNGYDVIENILCVCPNHHAQLDFLSIRIVPSKLRTVSGHNIDTRFIKHHNNRCNLAGLPK